MNETTIKDLRDVLEATGMKTRQVRAKVVDAIYGGQLKQKRRFSAVVTPGTGTIEEFVRRTVAAYKKDLDQADERSLSSTALELLKSSQKS